MLDKAKQYLTKNSLLALSGGPDSTALFYLLLEQQLPFRVCHVDHGWRDESKQEAKALARLCEERQVPFHLVVIENFDYEKGNIEDRFRKERYNAFRKIYFEEGCEALLLGHHRDDQAETVLKRIFEGSSLSSLGGMKCHGVYAGMNVVRPLLHHTKAMVLSFLESKGHGYFKDSSNHNLKYLRARMREEILPFLEERFGKNIRENLVLFGERMNHVAEYLEMRMATIMKDAKIEGSEVSIKVPKELHPLESEYLLRILSKKMEFTLPRKEIEKMQTILFERKGGKKIVIGEWEIVYHKDHLYCRKPQKQLQSSMTK